MDAVGSHGQLLSNVSLYRQLPTSTLYSRHAFGRKGVLLRRHVIRHHVVRISSQAGFWQGTAKFKKENGEKESESETPSGTKKVARLPPQIKLPGTFKLQNKSQSQAKNSRVVFVAGATGKVGSRTVRELLKLGFNVRASTRNVEKAQALFKDVGSSTNGAAGSDKASILGIFSPAKFFGFLKPKTGKKLEIVECDLEDPESIEPALGNAGVVICCIGAGEKEVLDVSGPYRIDFKATENLIKAATSAEVSHFVLLTSLGTQKFGFPAAVLNLFWGVLLWKAKAEKALLQSGLPYTIVRPGGMERPTDSYKETHNLVLAEADKLFGGQVSNLQVAELIASSVENPDVSVNKIVEAVAETAAPLRPIRELLEEISVKGTSERQSFKKGKPTQSDVEKADVEKEEEKNVKDNSPRAFKERQEKLAQAEKLAEEKRAQAQKENEAKRIQAERDEKEKQRLQELRERYEEEIRAAKEKAEAAKTAAAAALAEKDELEKKAAETRAKAEAAVLAARQAKAVEAAVLAAAQKGNVLSDEDKQKILKSVKLEMGLKGIADPTKQLESSPKKKTVFSFLSRAAPFSTTTVESPTEAESGKDVSEGADLKFKAEEEKLKREQEDAYNLAEAKKKKEQDRLDKEANERAEKKAMEAKQKEETEAKRKEQDLAEARKQEEEAEAQRKEKEVAEAIKQESEKKAKAEAETKRREEEKRVKMEAEVKRKQDEETEAKKREEEEKAKAEAELKRKEEEERVQIEAEAKRKQEEQAEYKKREEDENALAKAEAQRVEDELAEANAKKDEDNTKTKEEKEKEEMEAQAKRWEEEIAETKKKAEQEKEKMKEEKASTMVKEKEKETSTSEAVDKSRTAEGTPPRRRGFRWFWQPAEPETSEIEEKVKQEVTDGPAKAKLADQLPPCPTPLSPYTQYPGLKPPGPPIPSPPITQAGKAAPAKVDRTSFETKIIDQKMVKMEAPSFPKPTVPSESPQGEDLQIDMEDRKRKIEEVREREKEALEKAEAAAFSLRWPWQKSEEVLDLPAIPKQALDLPAIPKEEETTSSVIDKRAAPSATVLRETPGALPLSSRPLSPYVQFPNLKPPSPPRPSSDVQNGSAGTSMPAERSPVSSSSPSSPFPGFPDLKPPTSPTPQGNGAPAQEVKQEETPEPSGKVGGLQ